MAEQEGHGSYPIRHRRVTELSGNALGGLPEGSTEHAAELERASSKAVVRNIQETEERVEALLQRRRTFLDRLFPDAAQRARVQAELAMVRSEFEWRTRAIKLIREIQAQSLQEVFNAALIQQRAEIRSRTADYLLRRLNELQASFDAQYGDFNRRMLRQYDEAFTISYAPLREAEVQRLDNNVIGFREVGDRLLEEFEAIVNQQVRT